MERRDDDMDPVERYFITAMRWIAVSCMLMALAVVALVVDVVAR